MLFGKAQNGEVWILAAFFLDVILPPLPLLTQRDTNKSNSVHVHLNIYTCMQNEITESTREWELKCVTT